MSNKIDIGIEDILTGGFNSYDFKQQFEEVHAIVRNDLIESSVFSESDADKLSSDRESFNSESEKNEFVELDDYSSGVIEPTVDPELSPLENALLNQEWESLLQLAESELNSSPENLIAKSYWSLAALKTKSLRADLVSFGIINIWDEGLPRLNAEQVSELHKILIKTTSFAYEECLKVDLNLANKLKSFLPEKSDQVEIKENKEIFTDSTAAIDLNTNPPVDSTLVEYQNYLDTLTSSKAQVANSIISSSVKEQIENEQKIKEHLETNPQNKKSGLFWILSALGIIFLSLLVYLVQPQETPIGLVSEEGLLLETNSLPASEDPVLIIESDIDVPKKQDSPLNDIINQLENPEAKVIANSAPSIEPIRKLDNNLDLTGPVEPNDLADLLDGKVPTDYDLPKKELESQVAGNNVMEEHLRTGPIVGDRVSSARIDQPINNQPFAVYVDIETSLYNRPSRYEAELMLLYRGDRLLVLEDLGDWYKVDAFGRVIGYVEKSTVR